MFENSLFLKGSANNERQLNKLSSLSEAKSAKSNLCQLLSNITSKLSLMEIIHNLICDYSAEICKIQADKLKCYNII